MSTIKTDTLSNLAGSKTVPTDTVVDGSAKAWVNFNGTGTVAIRRAFNVSSITDNAVGNYTINLTNAMADANYSACGMCNDNGNTTAIAYRTGGTFSTSALQVSTSAGGGLADNANCLVSIFS